MYKREREIPSAETSTCFAETSVVDMQDDPRG